MGSDTQTMVTVSYTHLPVLAQKSMNEGYYVDGIGTSWKFMREAALDYGVIASQFDMLGDGRVPEQ